MEQSRVVITASADGNEREGEMLQKFLWDQGCIVEPPMGDSGALRLHDPLIQNRLVKIRNADFIVVPNFDARMAQSAVFELGYALAHGKQVLVLEPMRQKDLRLVCARFEMVFPDWKKEIWKIKADKIYNQISGLLAARPC